MTPKPPRQPPPNRNDWAARRRRYQATKAELAELEQLPDRIRGWHLDRDGNRCRTVGQQD